MYSPKKLWSTSLSQNMEKGVTKQTIYVWLNFDNFQTILVKTLTTLATIVWASEQNKQPSPFPPPINVEWCPITCLTHLAKTQHCFGGEGGHSIWIDSRERQRGQIYQSVVNGFGQDCLCNWLFKKNWKNKKPNRIR